MSNTKLLIFTDLDGSLLDHDNYSHAPADELLHAIDTNNIPLIPVSSKTLNELEVFRNSIHNKHPFIVENGAAAFIPVDYFAEQPLNTQTIANYWVKEWVAPRQHWQSLLENTAGEFSDCYTSFAQAGVEGIMAMTGLDVAAATRAAKKHYSEPLQWHGSKEQQQVFVAQLRSQGANVLEGGRFLHISGHCDKGIALKWLAEQFSLHSDQAVKTLAIGDSDNDIAMLKSADYAVVVRSPVHEPLQLAAPAKVYTSNNTGPTGWVEGVQHYLNTLNIYLR